MRNLSIDNAESGQARRHAFALGSSADMLRRRLGNAAIELKFGTCAVDRLSDANLRLHPERTGSADDQAANVAQRGHCGLENFDEI
jgi:hypothetical protein